MGSTVVDATSVVVVCVSMVVDDSATTEVSVVDVDVELSGVSTALCVLALPQPKSSSPMAATVEARRRLLPNS